MWPMPWMMRNRRSALLSGIVLYFPGVSRIRLIFRVGPDQSVLLIQWISNALDGAGRPGRADLEGRRLALLLMNFQGVCYNFQAGPDQAVVRQGPRWCQTWPG